MQKYNHRPFRILVITGCTASLDDFASLGFVVGFAPLRGVLLYVLHPIDRDWISGEGGLGYQIWQAGVGSESSRFETYYNKQMVQQPS